MMLRLASLALSSACLVACGSSPSDPANPDAASSGDATADTSADAPAIAGDCSGVSERFILTGAVTLDAHSAAAFTISGKVGGVVGAPMPDRLYSLAPRAQLATDFDVVGVHDI